MTSADGSMPTTGRWDRYRDHEGKEFQRVSTLIKKVETDRYNLDLWMKRQVLIGASLRDDLVLGAKAMKPHPVTGWSALQKKDLNKLVATAEEAAKAVDGAVVGTAVHTLSERLDRGEPIESVVAGLPAQAERDLRAYAMLIELNGWRSVEIERTVVNDELEVAGTFDRVYKIPALTDLLGRGYCQHGCGVGGEGAGNHEREDLNTVIGDVKTERSPDKSGLHIGPQLAIYARSRRMWLPEGRYVDSPCVRQDVAVVVHVRDGHATPYFVNIAEGWDAALAARAQNEREKHAKRWLAPMPNIREPRPLEVAVRTSVNQAAAAPATLTLPPVPDQTAVTGADGLVRWQPTPITGVTASVTVDGQALPITIRGALDEVDKQAIEAVWAAPDVEHLQRTTEIYTSKLGRQLTGRVQEAAAARWQQLTCAQRLLHTVGKCACGWVEGILP